MMYTKDQVDVCRLCLLVGRDFTSIYGANGMDLANKIASYLPVNISENDTLPKTVCAGCALKLEMYSQFRKDSMRSETILKTLDYTEAAKQISSCLPEIQSLYQLNLANICQFLPNKTEREIEITNDDCKKATDTEIRDIIQISDSEDEKDSEENDSVVKINCTEVLLGNESLSASTTTNVKSSSHGTSRPSFYNCHCGMQFDTFNLLKMHAKFNCSSKSPQLSKQTSLAKIGVEKNMKMKMIPCDYCKKTFRYNLLVRHHQITCTERIRCVEKYRDRYKIRSCGVKLTKLASNGLKPALKSKGVPSSSRKNLRVSFESPSSAKREQRTIKFCSKCFCNS